MSGALENVAHNWLTEPQWQKVFKHTFDVIEDYVTYVLVAVGAIALSVRLLTTLGTGDVQCILLTVNSTLNPDDPLGPYPPGGTVAMVNYAQTTRECITTVFTFFGEYLPYVMLFQTIILVIVEKFTFKIPRIAQKVERFYRNIVDESMFGKDPDVAEDMSDPKASTEAISRQRQRNEICVSLKRSSIIYNVYLLKNALEIVIVLAVYLPINLSYVLTQPFQDEEKGLCRVPLEKVPGIIDQVGEIILQCSGKKMSFFQLTVWIHICLTLLHGLCSMGSIVWCIWFRNITTLITEIQEMRVKQDTLVSSNQDHQLLVAGQDFLFLFDLLAHSCGFESTLRVLTHSDAQFHEIFKPNLHPKKHLILEEDRVNISWYPADIEKWSMSAPNRQRIIEIDSYEVTIFPAERVKNTQTVSSHSRRPAWKGDNLEDGLLDTSSYNTWFYDLDGGRTEYVLTIACMIGKSRMKGEKVITNLVPYGPEKPRAGMVSRTETDQAEIHWDPPKGDFTKYTLVIEKVSQLNINVFEMARQGLMRSTSRSSESNNVKKLVGPLPLEALESSKNLVAVDDPDGEENVRIMENLSNKLTSYTIVGLEPGEKYALELATKTGAVPTNRPIYDLVLTRPQPPRDLRSESVTSNSFVVYWIPPSKNSCLKGFQVQIKSASDSKIFKDVSVPKMSKQFTVLGVNPGSDYDVILTSLCSTKEERRSESEAVQMEVTTRLETVRNLKLEESTTDSLNVKWDPVKVMPTLKYLIHISSVDIEGDESINEDVYRSFTRTVEVSGQDRNRLLRDLPDGPWSGMPYLVTITTKAVTLRENEASSEPLKEIFITKPMPPTSIKPSETKIEFTPSESSNLVHHLVEWVKEGEQDAPQDFQEAISLSTATFGSQITEPGTYRFKLCAVSNFESPQFGTKTSKSSFAEERLLLGEDGKWSKAPDL